MADYTKDDLELFGYGVARICADAEPRQVKGFLEWVLDYLRASERARTEGATERGWEKVHRLEAEVQKRAKDLCGKLDFYPQDRAVFLLSGEVSLRVPVEWPEYVAPAPAPLKPMELYRPALGVSA
jgi:hypothetical protein